MAGKYDHIDFKPPKSVADAAARGLELRKKNKGKGGLSGSQAKKEGVGSGVQRAVNLKNRNTMSPSTVKRMKAFFSRHEKNKKADKGKSLSEDKGYIAWLLWGGNPGQSWANKVVKQMEAADKKKSRAAMYARAINKLAELKDHCADDCEMSFMEHSDEHDYMAIQNMYKICDQASYLKEFMEELELNDYKYPDWLESKISGIADDMEEVFGYMRYHLDEHMDTHQDDEHHEDLDDHHENEVDIQSFLDMLKNVKSFKQNGSLIIVKAGDTQAKLNEEQSELKSLGVGLLEIDLLKAEVASKKFQTNYKEFKTLALESGSIKEAVKNYLLKNDMFFSQVESSDLNESELDLVYQEIGSDVYLKLQNKFQPMKSKATEELEKDVARLGYSILSEELFSESIVSNKANLKKFIAFHNEKGLLGAVKRYLLENNKFKDKLESSMLSDKAQASIFNMLATAIEDEVKIFLGDVVDEYDEGNIPASSKPRAKTD